MKFKVGDLISMHNDGITRRITYIKDNRYGLEFADGGECTWYKSYNDQKFIEKQFKLDSKAMWDEQMSCIINEDDVNK